MDLGGTMIQTRNHVLVAGQITPGEGAHLEVIRGHVQTCSRSIFSTLFTRGHHWCSLELPVCCRNVFTPCYLRTKLSWFLSEYSLKRHQCCCKSGIVSQSSIDVAIATDVAWSVSVCVCWSQPVKVAHARLPSVGFRSWRRFFAVSLQVASVMNPVVGCHYFPLGLQLPSQPLRGLLPTLLIGEQRHNGCEQFA